MVTSIIYYVVVSFCLKWRFAYLKILFYYYAVSYQLWGFVILSFLERFLPETYNCVSSDLVAEQFLSRQNSSTTHEA